MLSEKTYKQILSPLISEKSAIQKLSLIHI